MAALTQQRVPAEPQLIDRLPFSLTNSVAVFRGGMVGLDRTTGKVTKFVAGNANLRFIGFFCEDKPSASGQTVNVQLARPVRAYWLDNTDGGNAAAATDVGKVCYGLDDHTITMTSTGNSKVGLIWAIGTINGVAMACVEPFSPANGDS